MKYLYYLYQLVVALPVTILMTIWTAVTVGLGCTFGDGHYWGYQINKIPFVGYACRKSHQIMVDRRGVGKVRHTYEAARKILETGNWSVVVFPEGARSFTGHMGDFKKGAFALADELQLPVVPLTINGSFNVMPRMRDWHFANWHPLSLTIHQPIYPIGQGLQNVQATMRQSYDSVMSALVPEYQGYVENPDQKK